MNRFLIFLIGGLFSCPSLLGQCDGPPPGASAFGGVLTCASQSVVLQGNSPTPGMMFTWLGPNEYLSYEQNPVVTESGIYFLEVRNPETSCTSVAYVIISFNYYEPEATATGGTISCAGSSVQLTGESPTPGVEYAWSGPQGFTSNLQNPVVTVPGNYYLTVTNPLTGCESLDIVSVEANSGICMLESVAINDINIALRDFNAEGSVLTNDYHPAGYDLFVEGFRQLGGSGTFDQVVTIQGVGVLSITDPLKGNYIFDPDPGFIGETDPFEYLVCDAVTGQCKTASLSIKVIDDKVINFAPVAINDHFQTTLGMPLNGTILSNDFDIDGDPLTVNAFALSGTSSHGGSWVLNPDNTFTYTPLPGFTGLDALFMYEICDGISACDMAFLTVWVLEPGAENTYKPSAVDDAQFTREGIPANGNVLENDLAGLSAENANLAYANGEQVAPGGTFITTISGGNALLFPDGTYSYTPAIGYTGSDRIEYQTCNNVGHCANATVYFLVLPPSCIELELWVNLEGPYQSDIGQMSAELNIGRSILPGQIPLNTAVTPTPAGNPYRGAPWNYSGIPAEEDYSGPYVNALGQAVTDWVLVSFRSGMNAEDEVAQASGLLYEDGHIEFIDPCLIRSSDPQQLWVVIEHRNHMGVMSDSAILVQSEKLTYDFRQSNSYHTTSSFGQKEVAPGVWAMYSGDGDQTDSPSYDINGTDNIIWVQQNGSFDNYLIGDFDLNGDINGADNILYSTNNGVSSSVPK